MTVATQERTQTTTDRSSAELEELAATGVTTLKQLEEERVHLREVSLPAAKQRRAALGARRKLKERVSQEAIDDAVALVANVEREAEAVDAACEEQSRRNKQIDDDYVRAL